MMQSLWPTLLRHLLINLFGCEDELNVNINNLFIAQNITYSVAKIRNPKHMAVAASLRQLTGSKEVVSPISYFGHCINYVDALRLETSAAKNIAGALKTTKVYIPSHIKREGFVFGAMSVDGKNYTHAINLILYIYQPQCEPCNGWQPAKVHLHSRSLTIGVADLYEQVTSERCI